MLASQQARARSRRWRAICAGSIVVVFFVAYALLVQTTFTMPSISASRIVVPGMLQTQNTPRPPAKPISALETAATQQPPLAPPAKEPQPVSANPPPAEEDPHVADEKPTPIENGGGGDNQPPAAAAKVAPAPPAPQEAAPALEPKPADAKALAPASAKKEALFKVIVMGWKRHASLARLLRSLQAAEYAGDAIDLDIRIDGGSGEDRDKSIAVAKAAEWPFGTKQVLINDKNEGLAAAWFKGWVPPSDDHRAMFLEDDIEVSPFWYKWVQLMYKAYGDKPWMAGVTLQHQTLNTRTGGQTHIKNDYTPFGYKLLGSWGFSPHPKHWREFIKIDPKKHDPHVPGLITSSWFKQVKKGSMWTQHFIWYTEKHNLFTIYLTPGDKLSMAANYREKGEHYQSSQGKDFTLVTHWDPKWDNPPATPNLYGWDCKLVPEPK